MTNVQTRPDLIVPPYQPSLGAKKTVKPVVAWAVWGVFIMAVAVYAMGRWMVDLPPSVPVGVSKVPTGMVWTLVVQQLIFPVILVFWIHRVVYRPWRQNRRLTWDGMIVIASLTVYWQDFLINMAVMWSSYNAGLINWGSWYNFVPGWVAPNFRGFAEAPTMVLAWWPFGLLAVMMTFNFVMRRAQARWPGISRLGLVAIAFALGFMLDLTAELLWLYGGTFHYGGAPGPKLFGGHYYQFPLFEMLFWGSAWATMSCYRYFRNDKGQTFTDKGIDELRVGSKGKTWIRLFSIIGFVNLIVLCYNLAWLIPSLHSHDWPDDVLKRSYFTQQLCGAGTDRACSGGPANDPALSPPKAIPSTKCPDSPYTDPLAGSC